jgi:hypothetical protein
MKLTYRLSGQTCGWSPVNNAPCPFSASAECTAENIYRYESDTGFSAEIMVDDLGWGECWLQIRPSVTCEPSKVFHRSNIGQEKSVVRSNYRSGIEMACVVYSMVSRFLTLYPYGR